MKALKSKNPLSLVVTHWPVAHFLGLLPCGFLIALWGDANPKSQLGPYIIWTIAIVHVLATLNWIIVSVYFFYDATRNSNIPDNRRMIWLFSFMFFSIFSLPIYWRKVLKPKDKQEYL